MAPDGTVQLSRPRLFGLRGFEFILCFLEFSWQALPGEALWDLICSARHFLFMLPLNLVWGTASLGWSSPPTMALVEVDEKGQTHKDITLKCLIYEGFTAMCCKHLNNNAESWDNLYKEGYHKKMDSSTQRPRYHAIAGMCAEFAKPSPKILDIGCGNGKILDVLRNLNPTYTGLDISPVAIRRAQEDFRSSDPTATFLDISVEEYDTDAKFDVIIWNEVLYYLPLHECEASLVKSFRLLSPGGLVIVSMAMNWKAVYVWKRIQKWLPQAIQATAVYPAPGTGAHDCGGWKVAMYRTG